MQKAKKLTSALLAPFALSASISMIPSVASADLSASFGAANLYLWRGLSLSDTAPQVYGSLDYAHSTGLYAGVWGSSEGAFGSSEYDIYIGWGGEFGGLGVDVQLVDYLYPEQPDDEEYFERTEFIGSISYGPAALTFIAPLGGEISDEEEFYTSASFDTDSAGVLFGYYDVDEVAFGTPDYYHIDLNYYATDELTFTLSFKQFIDDEYDDDDGNTVAFEDGDEDPLFVVNYSLGFDL